MDNSNLYRKLKGDSRYKFVEHNIDSRFYEEYYVYELFKKSSALGVRCDDNVLRYVSKKLYCKLRIDRETEETTKVKFYYDYHDIDSINCDVVVVKHAW
jgi:hypothetical protein